MNAKRKGVVVFRERRKKELQLFLGVISMKRAIDRMAPLTEGRLPKTMHSPSHPGRVGPIARSSFWRSLFAGMWLTFIQTLIVARTIAGPKIQVGMNDATVRG